MEIARRHRKGNRKNEAVEYGNLVFIAGQIANDLSLDAEGQTREVLEKIDSLLIECGTDKSKLLWAQCWVTDMRNFDAMNKVWDEWVDPDNLPVRAGLCSSLAQTEFLVEIMVTAAR